MAASGRRRTRGRRGQIITDGKSTIASVGAIALAPSDPNVIWVGTGETDWREDLTHGDGVWRSTDGGESWQHLGLDDTRHIGVIRVHPTNPDIAYVAAMGHAFGPNAMRGVFRTTDGGKTWTKVLYLDDNTGAIDLAMDPSNPRILYAAMWRARRSPWGLDGGGGRSGLWKSIDGGDTWTELSGEQGHARDAARPHRHQRLAGAAAPRLRGRRGARQRGRHLPLRRRRRDVDAHQWRPDVPRARLVLQRCSPPIRLDPNTVYVMNLSVLRSIDGGRTFSRVRVPHGDTHIMWIDPKDPNRMINGNDGGAQVSLDGGASWSSVYTQPTAQFYHVITDNQFPYRDLRLAAGQFVRLDREPLGLRRDRPPRLLAGGRRRERLHRREGRRSEHRHRLELHGHDHALRRAHASRRRTSPSA